MPDDKLPTPERVLVIAAHPDDIEFGASGTIARWVTEGATVRYLLVTRGDKGSDDANADIDALVRLREQEQRAAAAETVSRASTSSMSPTARSSHRSAFASGSPTPSGRSARRSS